MNNLDRTTAEFEFEDPNQEFEYENYGEYEDGYGYEDEFAGGDYKYENEFGNGEYEDSEYVSNEWENNEYGSNEWEDEYETNEESGPPFSPEEEIELATELLGAGNDEELDHFFGALAALAAPLAGRAVKWIGRKIKKRGRRMSRRLAGQVFGNLKKVKKATMPTSNDIAMQAANSNNMANPSQLVPPPSSMTQPSPPAAQMSPPVMQSPPGDMSGAYSGTQSLDDSPAGVSDTDAVSRQEAAQLYGLESEGMSPEDREFEMAKRFVNLAGETIRQAIKLEPHMPPEIAANQAIKNAAEVYAPGLNRPRRHLPPRHVAHPHTGRWHRTGNRLILADLNKSFYLPDANGGGFWQRQGNNIVLHNIR